jgi:hypothetical protein
VIIYEGTLLVLECRYEGGAPAMSPSRHFPDVSSGDILVRPIPLRFSDHLLKMFVGCAGFFLIPEALPHGLGCSLALVVPPSGVKPRHSPHHFHGGFAGFVEGKVYCLYPLVDVRWGRDGGDRREFKPVYAIPLLPGRRINVGVKPVGAVPGCPGNRDQRRGDHSDEGVV